MRNRWVAPALQSVIVLYLAASAVELLDRSGLVDEDSAAAAAAETMRETRSGDDPLGVIDEAERIIEAAQKLLSAFDELGEALN